MNKMEFDKSLKQKMFSIWIVFFIYLILYFVICLGLGNQQFLWLELACFSMIISVYLLFKNKMPKKKSIIIYKVIKMILYIARHGESLGNTGEDTGPDPKLSQKGKKQAKISEEIMKIRGGVRNGIRN